MTRAGAIAGTGHQARSPVQLDDVSRHVGDNAALNLGCLNHCRFYGRLLKSDGAWKIFDRKAIYDLGTFTFPDGVVEVDQATVQKHPRKYAPFVYLLEKSGFPISGFFPTRGSEWEKQIKTSGKPGRRSSCSGDPAMRLNFGRHHPGVAITIKD